MIRTSSIDFAAVILATGFGQLVRVLPPTATQRLSTFELSVAEEHLANAQRLELGYNDLTVFDMNRGGAGNGPTFTLGDFLDAVQRVRRAMIASRSVQR